MSIKHQARESKGGQHAIIYTEKPKAVKSNHYLPKTGEGLPAAASPVGQSAIGIESASIDHVRECIQHRYHQLESFV